MPTDKKFYIPKHIKFISDDTVVPLNAPRDIDDLMLFFDEPVQMAYPIEANRFMDNFEKKEAENAISTDVIEHTIVLNDALNDANEQLALAKSAVKDANEAIKVFHRKQTDAVRQYKDGTILVTLEKENTKSIFKDNYMFFYTLINEKWHLVKFDDATNTEIERHGSIMVGDNSGEASPL